MHLTKLLKTLLEKKEVCHFKNVALIVIKNGYGFSFSKEKIHVIGV